ncbi:inositol monophosphatase family protein [Pseudobacteriovorax antillogorgiicola]|uniref:Histidinol-phosphate phosphatase n=1 Tax=Pseudobacteriovorax antillogorgiicola TaxID=1513793 RepID=A0A1Y6CW60_9BACT|nr:inositol monophosphatase family protein [Pseudobacteriovorax antillogorgiicola]TCS42112.1 histidinol-phosphate phosphatase [Pseudobacteriovorax antillogorgiicola]SMF83064.1 histidinol-phosphate phosphatase [Pseudobacteriovorax antillogorgiicola]
MASKDIQERYEWGHRTIVEVAEIARSHFSQKGLIVETKADESPVTIADRAVEEAFRKAVQQDFPEDGILGEEYDSKDEENGFRWVIDPIDGTYSFIHGVPLWGTLLALEFEGSVVAGWAYMPELGELVSAAKGQGAQWLRGYDSQRQAFSVADQVTVSRDKTSLKDALFCHSSSDYFREADQYLLLQALETEVSGNRCWSDCYAMVLLATGRVDLVVEPALQYWDYAPFLIIVPEAGGVIKDFAGQSPEGKTNLVIASKELYPEAAKFVTEHMTNEA